VAPISKTMSKKLHTNRSAVPQHNAVKELAMLVVCNNLFKLDLALHFGRFCSKEIATKQINIFTML
jgi:hypothetical protein